MEGYFGHQQDWLFTNLLDEVDFVAPTFTDMDAPEPQKTRMEITDSLNSSMATVSALPTSPLFSEKSPQESGRAGRKRRHSRDSSCDGQEEEDEDGMEVDQETKKYSRKNHSDIEKRRRDKMNTYIVQLAAMLPMCNAMNRKCDKLTVLRMAVQHMKSLRGSATSYIEASHKPSFLSEDELKHVILEAADGFLFVVGCDRARILFVSESVNKILHYTRSELMGQSLFDFIHPRDITKVKEQFSSSDLQPRERLIDAKTMMPVKSELPQRPTHLCSGARRSFYCRMKFRSENEAMDNPNSVKTERDDIYVHRKRKSDQKSYTVIHFTGYLKSWPPSKVKFSSDEDCDDNSNFLSCLVAIGQTRTASGINGASGSTLTGQKIERRATEYMFRFTLDGKFSFIDQATTMVLGYLPQELLGTSVYEYYHQDDITHMADIHRKVLESKEKVQTGVYRCKSKNGSFLPVRSECFSFTNPWTKEIEYIVCTSSVVPADEVSSSGQCCDGVVPLDIDCATSDDFSVSASSTNSEKLSVPGLPGGTRPGAGRIGRQIADEVLETPRGSRSPQVVHSTNTAENFEAPNVSSSTKRMYYHSLQNNSKSHTGNNPNMSTSSVTSNHSNHISNGFSSAEDVQSALLDTVIEEQALDEMTVTGTGEGDEAAMSMIMSLLEADAGLGGPIDFNDLPWPL